MRTRIAIGTATLTLLAGSSMALALQNPVVSHLQPVGNSHVNVGVDLDNDVTNAAADVRTGSCRSYQSNAKFPLVAVNGTSQQTHLGKVSLQQLVGNVIVIHKTSADSSPVVACGEIKG
jgi:hypothetical protein